MYLIVGLGNPDKEYLKTRHNIGFMVLDLLAKQNNFSFNENAFNAQIAKQELWGHKILFIKPQTYMNLSGTAVSAVANFYKISPMNILVISDDLALPLGNLRFRDSGSSGGQKGLEDIIQKLGTNKFYRLRVGIGPQTEFGGAKNFVLSKFSKVEEDIVEPALLKATQTLEKFFSLGFVPAQQFANTSK